MKKFFFILLILITAAACKKTKFEPEGPTDVRVRNMQGAEVFTDVVINTAGVRDTVGNVRSLGTINPGEVSAYKRVKIAFSKAEITAKINGEIFSTGPVNSTYMDYKGQMKITYEVYISNMTNKILMISNVIPEAPLEP
ncbi:MAG TPA: hypothetical protein PK719_00795 [Bacteroidales bacterium]|jgi:hypothetical protein|nr:hypothetical protein [Bacteroidales bacterium]OQB65666.1 MAG: hypothetical protein BWX96_00250 [Bacteroidetes bacterium ADurb.Bin145]NMD04030.1 hypothetical protein [Bacteroidales bacterium]HOU02121.1 hypothetical protein [Bacteroidales bacterium]HQG62165.1 hypothetical protein [Bacteroidales bacterium]